MYLRLLGFKRIIFPFKEKRNVSIKLIYISLKKKTTRTLKNKKSKFFTWFTCVLFIFCLKKKNDDES